MLVERRAQSALQQQELQLDTARAEMESLRESFGMLKELRNDAHQRALDDLSTDVERALSRVECQQLTAEMRETSKELCEVTKTLRRLGQSHIHLQPAKE